MNIPIQKLILNFSWNLGMRIFEYSLVSLIYITCTCIYIKDGDE